MQSRELCNKMMPIRYKKYYKTIVQPPMLYHTVLTTMRKFTHKIYMQKRCMCEDGYVEELLGTKLEMRG